MKTTCRPILLSEVDLTFQGHVKVMAFKMAAISETAGRRAKISKNWAHRVCVDYIGTTSAA